MKNIPTQTDFVTALPAADFNEIPTEMENLILKSGQTLTSADLLQISQAVQDISLQGQWYIASGVNSITLTNTNHPLSKRYIDGQIFRFKASANNSGAVTVAIDSLATKDLIHEYNSNNLGTGSIRNGIIYTIMFNDSIDKFQLLSFIRPQPVVNVTVNANAGSFTGYGLLSAVRLSQGYYELSLSPALFNEDYIIAVTPRGNSGLNPEDTFSVTQDVPLSDENSIRLKFGEGKDGTLTDPPFGFIVSVTPHDNR